MKKKLNYMWVIIVTCFIMEFVALGFCSSNKSLYLGAITEALNIPRSFDEKLYQIANEISI